MGFQGWWGIWGNEVKETSEVEEDEKVCRSSRKLGMMFMGGNCL